MLWMHWHSKHAWTLQQLWRGVTGPQHKVLDTGLRIIREWPRQHLAQLLQQEVVETVRDTVQGKISLATDRRSLDNLEPIARTRAKIDYKPPPAISQHDHEHRPAHPRPNQLQSTRWGCRADHQHFLYPGIQLLFLHAHTHDDCWLCYACPRSPTRFLCPESQWL